MRTVKLKIAATATALLFVAVTLGQSLYLNEAGNNVTPVSPEAAALSKMVNYPVNHNTGVPDIRVPFYNVKSGNLTLPIDFVYHAGGFKINEQATAAGMGWSLSCDLQITRSINGLDDFYGYCNSNTFKVWPVHNHNPNGTGVYDLTQYHKYSFATGEADGAPDKFYFKLLNKSGSFYFLRGTNLMTVCEPYEDLKIELIDTGFVITDTDGTKYTFGGGEGEYITAPSSIDWETDDRKSIGIETSDNAVTTWKCMKIENFNRSHTIEFEYQNRRPYYVRNYQDRITYWERQNHSGDYGLDAHDLVSNNITTKTALSRSGYRLDYLTPHYEVAYSGYRTFMYFPYIDQSGNVQHHRVDWGATNNYSSVDMRTLQLSKIKFDGGEIDFSYIGEKDALLDRIAVSDANNHNEIKAVKLHHTYTENPYDNPPFILYLGTNYLDSIVMQNGSNAYERYRFQYNNKFYFGSHLKGSDMWGHVNSSTGTIRGETTTIPKITEFMTLDVHPGGTSTRNISVDLIGSGYVINPSESDGLRMKNGVLNKITYPTGGSVEFEFEVNRYSIAENTETKNGGGLRIKSIKYFDKDKVALRKDYEYGRGVPANLAYIINLLYNNNFIRAFSYSHTIQYTSGSTAAVKTYLPTTAIDWNHANGSPIYYSEVTEYNGDSNGQFGKTVYKYKPMGPLDSKKSIIENTNIRRLHPSWDIGGLQSISEYECRDNIYTLVHKKEYDYDEYTPDYTPRVIWSYINKIDLTVNTHIYGERAIYNCNADQYELPVGRTLLSKETETWVYDSGIVKQTTDYEYGNLNDGKLQPTKVIIDKSDGGKLKKEFEYPYHYNSQPYVDMVSRNNIEPVILERAYSDNVLTSTKNAKYNLFQDTMILPKAIEQAYVNEPLRAEITFDKYDNKGNILQISTKENVPTTYLWSYSGSYPVAEIKNATYLQVENSLGAGFISRISSAVIPSSTDIATLNALRSSLPDALITTYTYKPLVGVTSTTDPSGRATKYEYDAFNRLLKIKDDKNNADQEFEYNYQ